MVATAIIQVNAFANMDSMGQTVKLVRVKVEITLVRIITLLFSILVSVNV